MQHSLQKAVERDEACECGGMSVPPPSMAQAGSPSRPSIRRNSPNFIDSAPRDLTMRSSPRRAAAMTKAVNARRKSRMLTMPWRARASATWTYTGPCAKHIAHAGDGVDLRWAAVSAQGSKQARRNTAHDLDDLWRAVSATHDGCTSADSPAGPHSARDPRGACSGRMRSRRSYQRTSSQARSRLWA